MSIEVSVDTSVAITKRCSGNAKPLMNITIDLHQLVRQMSGSAFVNSVFWNRAMFLLHSI